ncbi:MAG: DUF2029 domain-containing protein [Planctomycetes bacterium]|nr:DUF2029 domain-containing protein [Planctomycetota bacterium]
MAPANTSETGVPQKSPSPATRRPAVRLNVIIFCMALSGICLLAFKTIPRALTDSADFAVYYCTGRAWGMGENPYFWQFNISDGGFDADPYRIRLEDEKIRNVRSGKGDWPEYGDITTWFDEIHTPLPITYYTGGAPTDLLDDAMTPPPALPLLGLFGIFSWPIAKTCWLILNLLLILFMIDGLTRLVGAKPAGSIGILLLFITFCLAAVHTCIGLGQLTIAAVACIIWAEVWRREGRTILPGLVLAVGIALKPQMAGVFLIWWLVRQKLRASVWTIMALVILTSLSVSWLNLGGSHWLTDLQANIHQFFNGGRGDFTAQPVGYQFLNLAYPLYLVFGHLEIARAAAWTICLVGVGFLIHFARRPLDTLDELAVIGSIGLLSLLAVYNRLYGAVWLVVPLAWGICQAFKGQRLGKVVCLLCVPFLLPGPSILNYLAAQGYVGKTIAENPVWKIILVPHQIYLLAAILCCLIAGLARSAKVNQYEQLQSPR